MRARRRNLSIGQRAKNDLSICSHLQQLIESRQATSLAVFAPFDGEPDILPVCEQMIRNGNELALPVVSGDESFTMKFHAWNSSTQLKTNFYGIVEPDNSPARNLKSFDILLMPLVSFDKTGNRIGMGAGYYDRHLEPLRDSAIPLRVGVAYGLQESDYIEPDAWDVPLHMVITEYGLHSIGDG